MKKLLLIASLILNVVFIGKTVVSRFKTQAKPQPKNDSLIVFSFNKYRFFAGKKALYDSLPINRADIVFFGNSLIENFPASELLNNTHIKNRGISGNTSIDLLDRIDAIAKRKPSKIFIMDGINDIFSNIPKDTTIKNFVKMVNVIKAKSPGTIIYLLSVLPVSLPEKNKTIIAYNETYKSICQSNGILYVDVFTKMYNGKTIIPNLTYDGTHLTGNGYLILKRTISKLI